MVRATLSMLCPALAERPKDDMPERNSFSAPLDIPQRAMICAGGMRALTSRAPCGRPRDFMRALCRNRAAHTVSRRTLVLVVEFPMSRDRGGGVTAIRISILSRSGPPNFFQYRRISSGEQRQVLPGMPRLPQGQGLAAMMS